MRKLGLQTLASLLFINSAYSYHCARIVGVTPHVKQPTPITCGPSCLHSAYLRWKIPSPGVMALGFQLGTFAHQFTWPELIAGDARRRGLYAVVEYGQTEDDLWRYLQNAETVIVGWWYFDSGHLTTLTGIDRSSVWMMDPWVDSPEAEYNKDWFVANWYRYAIRISGAPLPH